MEEPNRTTINLEPVCTDIRLGKATPEQTEILYNSTQWPHKQCIYIVPGQWEIESIVGHEITLVNYDQIIKEHATN